MGRQKQTKLPKNTHHIYETHTHCHSRPPFYLPLLWNSSFSTLIPPSFVPNSPLHFIHPRETKLCYLHLPLWLFGIKIIYLPLSVLQCTFSPCDLGCIFPRSTLFSFPYLKKLFLHRRGRHFIRALRAHTCKLRSAHSVSVLRQKNPSIGRSHSLLSPSSGKKIPSQKNCISKSPVEKSSVVPSNVCLGSATNHKLHESFPPLHRLYNSL